MSLATRNGGGPINPIAAYEDEGREVQVQPVSAYGTAIRSEIESQVAVAKRNPRSIKRFLDTATTIATINPTVAKSCIYALERWDGKEQKKKVINGPSVRLAEIMSSCYQNLRVQTQVVDMDDRFVTVIGTCLDTENNIGVSIEVKRRITNKDGKTYSEDMIAVTTAAASSIARRNAIFAVIPNAFRDVVYQAAKEVACGRGESFEDTRNQWIDYFIGLGIGLPRILAALDVRGADDITMEHLATFIGLDNRYREGEDIQALFPIVETVKPAASKTSEVADKLKAKPEVKPQREPGNEG